MAENFNLNEKIPIAILGGFALYSVLDIGISLIRKSKMKNKGKNKLLSRNCKAFVPKNVDFPKREKILTLNASQLVEAVNNNELTPDDILSTYIERARDIGRRLNLTAEEVFEDASRRTLNLPDGLLKGVPISIKDELFQDGCQSTTGVAWRLDHKDPYDNILVLQLRRQGALPFVRGNSMQLAMWFETTNNIYGTAVNPWDPTRSTGGSSGGDAGLVASRATVIGIGSDIAGSIRFPAACCGVYSFMPTPLRTTHRDWANPHPNLKEPTEILIKTSYGPIGRCVDDLALVLKSWWDKNFWKYDAYVIPKPFNTKSYEKTTNKKLRIAYFDDNQVFPCAEVVKTVIRETVNKLKNDGHELVEMNTDFFAHAFEYASRLFFGIDPSIIVDELQGESPAFPFKPQYINSECSVTSMFEPAALSISGYRQFAEALNAPRIYTLKEFCTFAEQVCLFKSEFTDYWNQMGFDCVICPVWPLVAPQHNKTEYLFPAFSYLYFWNIMSFPAGVVPVRKVKKGEDNYNTSLKDGASKVAKEIMKDSVGLPVAIQVAGYPSCDEKVLGVMKIIENYYNFHEYPL